MSAETLFLDQAGGPDAHAVEGLRRRVAAYLELEASDIVLAATPESFALVGLDPAKAQVIGPDDQPLAACEGSMTARTIEATLTGGAIAAALDAMTPVSRAAKAADDRLRQSALELAARVFESWDDVASVNVRAGALMLQTRDAAALQRQLMVSGLVLRDGGEGRFEAICPAASQAQALCDRLGRRRGRTALIRRTTKETDITVVVDLDRDGPVSIRTGIEFFDHMLDQVARHGGFALDVTAQGDLGVDAHHTIEDVCLALGEAIREALGDKRGLARFGFELPMDETRAGVWIDLSGRPFCRFEGDIPGERVAGFPVEMCAHAFRSLSEAMKASIHVTVTGSNAHHMIEACFKAFGRAMRQAVRVEGDAIPSTKGVV